jgi:hypothetical protein
MVLRSNDLEDKNVGATNFAHLRNELIQGQNSWQAGRLMGEREIFPKPKVLSKRRSCYTEYFVAQRLDNNNNEKLTVAELVAENVSSSIVLLALIATKPEVRCSGIGSALLKYFRRTVEQEKPDATIFLEVDDPDVADISDAERQIRIRRLNWYLRQGAVMWNGYYEMPHAFDKRRHGNKAILMALPRRSEIISYQQLQEAALEILKTGYGLSTKHWLYKKVQGQRCTLIENEKNLAQSENSASPVAIFAQRQAGDHLPQTPQTLSFLKAQMLHSTKYDVLSPEEAIRKYLELERASKLERFNKSCSEGEWPDANLVAALPTGAADQATVEKG